VLVVISTFNCLKISFNDIPPSTLPATNLVSAFHIRPYATQSEDTYLLHTANLPSYPRTLTQPRRLPLSGQQETTTMSAPLAHLAFPRLVRPTVATMSATATRLMSQTATTSSGDVSSRKEITPVSTESTQSSSNDEIAQVEVVFSRSTDPATEKSEIGSGVHSEAGSTTTTTSPHDCAASAGSGAEPDKEVPVQIFLSGFWL